MPDQKRVLFVSALDFKKKSIQVIRKTPEAFARAGWKVDYLVARDNSKKGNYFYEQEINPKGVNIHRHYWPLRTLRDPLPGKLHIAATKLAALSTNKLLYREARKLLKANHYDVIYGYEIPGVLAVGRLRRDGLLNDVKVVSRFQGTWLTHYYLTGNTKKLRLNQDAIKALRLPSDLCIMTNDGTQGDVAMEKLGAPENHGSFVFWTNGVDDQKLEPAAFSELKSKYKSNNDFIFLTISRLESWKRLDRVIDVFHSFVQQSTNSTARLIIVGEGSQRPALEARVRQYELNNRITFTGGVEHQDVKKYLNLADAFISMYDLSNVGNPLLEAIRANKIIFTLNNGDTSRWIKHGENGFIYDVNDSLIESAAQDMHKLVHDPELQNKIVEGVKRTESEMLWTWEERMNAEVEAVSKLLDESN